MAAVIAQTIQIVDKSGKVVGTSKQLRNVFTEAKLAYQERKAEIKAERKQKEERELRKAIKAMSVADVEERSDVSRSQTQRRPDAGRRRSSGIQTQHGDPRESSRSMGASRQEYRRGSNSPQSPGTPPVNLAQFNQDLYGTYNRPRDSSRSAPTTPYDEPSPNQLMRRVQTDSGMAMQLQQRPNLSRSATDVDMDLAYGEFHAPDIMRNPSPPMPPEKELNSLVLRCQGLLDEAQCAGYSVKKIVTHLQDNPEAMAAVALTLAEISNVASKLAPGALAAFKGSAPAVMALLAAPEFLIAVGVGVGITVVMFGGYKIIKKIKEKRLTDSNNSSPQEGGNPRDINAGNNNNNMDEMIDVHELDRIELWRRGISEDQLLPPSSSSNAHRHNQDDTRSMISGYSAATGTTVEGEFITPFAQRSMGHLPLPSSSLSKSKSKSKSKSTPKSKEEGVGDDKDKDKKQKKKRKEKKENDDDSVVSESSSGSRATLSKTSSKDKDRDKQIIKVKKPSPLRRMFSVAPSSN